MTPIPIVITDIDIRVWMVHNRRITTNIPTIREVALRDVSERFASRRMQALGLNDEAREQFLGVMFFEGLLIRRLGEWALTAAGAAMLAKAAA